MNQELSNLLKMNQKQDKELLIFQTQMKDNQTSYESQDLRNTIDCLQREKDASARQVKESSKKIDVQEDEIRDL